MAGDNASQGLSLGRWIFYRTQFGVMLALVLLFTIGLTVVHHELKEAAIEKHRAALRGMVAVLEHDIRQGALDKAGPRVNSLLQMSYFIEAGLYKNGSLIIHVKDDVRSQKIGPRQGQVSRLDHTFENRGDTYYLDVTGDLTDVRSALHMIFTIGLLIGILLITCIAIIHYRVTQRGAGELVTLTNHINSAINELQVTIKQREHLSPDEIELALHAINEKFVDVNLETRESRGVGMAFRDVLELLGQAWKAVGQREGDAVMGEVAVQVAHDIRAPLTVLRALNNHIIRTESEQGVTLHSDRIAEIITKLSDMANCMCDIARAKNVRCDQLVDAAAVAQGVIRDVQLTSNSHVLRYAGPEECFAHIDGPKITRVLTNLVSNAVYATRDLERGIITLELSMRNGKLVMQVRDNGCGIADENLSQLFTKHFSTKGESGNGLGLAYCKDVVVAHGGHIGVESQVGEGAKFTIELPTVNA